MGGLLRSQGGWTGVKALRETGNYQKGDERILGNGDFVAQVLAGAQEKLERKYRLAANGHNFDRVTGRVAQVFGMPPEEILSPGKTPLRVRARDLLCYWATTELGISQTEITQRLPLTQSAVSRAVKRGASLVRLNKYTIEPGKA